MRESSSSVCQEETTRLDEAAPNQPDWKRAPTTKALTPAVSGSAKKREYLIHLITRKVSLILIVFQIFDET